MPDYRLRSWCQQTLYDCRDYLVTADTIEQAAAMLREDQQFANDEGHSVSSVPGVLRIVGGTLLDEVRPLEPEEVVDGDSGIMEIDAAGERIRDLIDPEDAPDAATAALRLAEMTAGELVAAPGAEATLYRVRWEIDIEASNAPEAATKALAIQRDPGSIAAVFDVWGSDTPLVANNPIDFERVDLTPED